MITVKIPRLIVVTDAEPVNLVRPAVVVAVELPDVPAALLP